MQVIEVTEESTKVFYNGLYYVRTTYWYPFRWYKLHDGIKKHSPRLQVSKSSSDILDELYEIVSKNQLREQKLKRICKE